MTQRRGTSRAGADRSVEDRLGLLEAAERVAMLGSWEWLPQSDVLSWSDNLYRIFGLEPGEIIPDRAFVFEQTHPDDRERLVRYVEALRRISNPSPVEYRIQQPGRGVHYLRATITTVESDVEGATRIVGAVQDVSQEHLTSSEIAAHLAVSRTLAEWDSRDDPAKWLLSELGGALGFVFGAVWLPRDDVLVPTVIWMDDAVELDEFAAATLALRVTRGASTLPGLAWQTKLPEIVGYVDTEYRFRRRVVAGRVGLRGAVTFPALHSGDVVAVVELHSLDDVEPIYSLQRTMSAIGAELGEFLSHRVGQLGRPLLTERQVAVLQLAAGGRNTDAIATELGIAASTVRTHFDHVYERLGVADRAAAVAHGVRLGLIR